DAVVARYIELMGLRGFEDAYPKTLSGGMKQRVALARAYAVKSDFLLMDEPFGALDAQTRTAMQDLLLHVLETEGKTVLFITHSVEEALYLSSRVVVITARPSRIRRVIDVPFPYPRREELHRHPEFAELEYELRELVMQEYVDQERQKDVSLTAWSRRNSMNSPIARRSFLRITSGAAAAAAGWTGPAQAQAPTKVNVGYLHVVTVDAQLMLGQELGTYKKEGLDLQLREFTTGVELFQALVA